MKYKIETVPMLPPHWNTMSELNRMLQKLKTGQSIVVLNRHEQTHAYRIARRLNITITTRKLDGAGIRVFRIQ